MKVATIVLVVFILLSLVVIFGLGLGRYIKELNEELREIDNDLNGTN